MTRPFGPILAFGTAGIGNLYRPVSDRDAREALEAALAGGISDFDTAPHYGFGLAERRLGEALVAAGAGYAARVSTKVGRVLVPTRSTGVRHGFADADPFEPVFDYGRDGVFRAFESSLQRLRCDRVDTLFVHDLGRQTHGADDANHRRRFLDEGYAAMIELRDAGVVRRIGIGVNEVEVCVDLLGEVSFDVILLAGRYTLLEQGGLYDLLPLCAQRGIALYMAGPFNSGILASDGPGGPYNYAAAPPQTVERVERLRAACGRHGVSLRAAALAMAASHPATQAVVAGLSSAAEVFDILDQWNATVPSGLWTDLARQGLLDPAALQAGVEVLQ